MFPAVSLSSLISDASPKARLSGSSATGGGGGGGGGRGGGTEDRVVNLYRATALLEGRSHISTWIRMDRNAWR